MLKPGEVINGYTVEEMVSRGNFAESWRATKNGRRVFLKAYLGPKPSIPWFKGYVAYQEELRRRIEASPVRGFMYEILEFFVATRAPRHLPVSSLYYQVFAWVDDGEDLKAIIEKFRRNRSAFTWEQRLTWGKVIVGSLAQLHSQKIVHGDLKPENLILYEEPSIKAGYRLKLIDLDFSILSDRTAPWHGEWSYVQSPGWGSPEHLRGEIPSHASDIFTCGLILYDLLGRGNPYGSLDDKGYAAAVLAHKAARPRLEGEVPGVDLRTVEDALHRCLSPRAADRPRVDELSVALLGRRPPAPAAAVTGWAVGPAPIPGGAPVAGSAGPKAHRAGTPPVAVKVSRDPVAAAPLTLVGASGSMTFRIATQVTRYSVRPFGADSEFWDKNVQFSLRPGPDGWFLSPNVGATNATLVNGKAVTAERKLTAGDEISVGNEARASRKLPFTVRLES